MTLSSRLGIGDSHRIQAQRRGRGSGRLGRQQETAARKRRNQGILELAYDSTKLLGPARTGAHNR
jgi:hypothetical protein